MDLPKVLADLRAAGASRARYSEKDGAGCESSIEVEFGAAPAKVTPAGFVDADGKPINLDEGMGTLEVDPLEEAEPDEVLAKNYDPKADDAAG